MPGRVLATPGLDPNRKSACRTNQNDIAPAARWRCAMLALVCRREKLSEQGFMGKRISRCVELLEQDQAIYYDGPHSGHVLTHAQGRIDVGTWADYMNIGMEHGC